MGHKSNVVRHDVTSWKSYDILKISWKSSKKSTGNLLEICDSSTIGHKNMMRLAGNQIQFWKSIGISRKSDENQLEISCSSNNVL